MARVYSSKKGRHGSKKPPVKITPRWAKYKKEEIENLVVKLAKERHNTAVIGTILRDQYGVPDVKAITGKTVTKIMRENNLLSEMPEDMLTLLKKAVLLREHLERNRADKNSQKGLENLESKIRRLGKYYVRKGLLPKKWVYRPEEAKLIVQK
jgi:small subunit ribosomal protein S15